MIHLNEFQNYCLKHHIPFVSYRLPDSELPVTLIGDKGQSLLVSDDNDPRNKKGFLVAPFLKSQSDTIFIPDTQMISGWLIDEENFEIPSTEVMLTKAPVNLPPIEVDFETYTRQVNTICEKLRNGEAEKVVLSRISEIKEVNLFQLPLIFNYLCNKHPEAMVYLLFTPETGIWVGATPELLVKSQNNEFSTMALAGTRKVENRMEPNWSRKEIHEQALVSKFIAQQLDITGFDYKILNTTTHFTGELAHLCTMFTGKFSDKEHNFFKLVETLHPTPAVCGTNGESAMEIIAKVESHQREYYTGYLGPIDPQGDSSVFVILRCMKVGGNSAWLFAGGGILADSAAHAEWNETEYKLNVLRKAISESNRMSSQQTA